MRIVTAAEYRALFDGEEEFAVIDTRELCDFYRGHLLAASPLPLSRIEIDAPRLMPRRSVLVVLSDWGTAADSAAALGGLGYHNIAVIEGGLTGWHLAGGRVFPGWNAQGKAFGAYFETARATPTISSDELAEIFASGQKPLILDTRSEEEHVDYCLPGSILCPNQEMIYRGLSEIVARGNPDELVVTHCAGRTRGIMGARALIDAGVPNRVVSLAKGTLEWSLNGYEVERGAHRVLGVPADPSAARAAAERLARHHGVGDITLDTLRGWQGDPARTVYLFDIRTPAEAAESTLPGARAIAGGQLQQGVDLNIATRNARVVLMDTDGVRARQIGAILRQMGHRDVYSLTVDPSDLSPPRAKDAAPADPTPLRTYSDTSRFVLADIRGAVAYRHAHVAGSWWLARRHLALNLTRLPPRREIVLISDEPAFAALVAADLARLGCNSVIRCDPLEDWTAAGFSLETGPGQLAGEPADAIYDLEEREVHIRDSHEYLDWLTSLYHIVGGDPAAPYMPVPEDSR